MGTATDSAVSRSKLLLNHLKTVQARENANPDRKDQAGPELLRLIDLLLPVMHDFADATRHKYAAPPPMPSPYRRPAPVAEPGVPPPPPPPPPPMQ